MPEQNTEGIAERYTARQIVLYTPTQLEALQMAAKMVNLPVGTYIRSISLALPIRQPRIVVLDKALYARMMGALGDAGSRLERMIELLEIGESPYAEDFRTTRSKVEMAATTALEILEQQ